MSGYYYEGNGNFSTDEQRSQNKAKSQTAGKKSAQPQKKDSDMAGWLFIAFMFAVAWPIGLILPCDRSLKSEVPCGSCLNWR